MEAHKHQTYRHFSIGLAGFACLLLGGCFGPNHPDRARYEYRYIDGELQSPYSSFPTGAERADWTCYDQKVQRAFNCTMVRGGWQEFKYIYRERR